MENPKDLIMEQLLHSEDLPPVTPELLRIDSFRLTSQTEVPKEQFLFRYFDKPCFPRKELTTITGLPKSGKTFFTSMVMACCVHPQIMALERISDTPLRVMWYDTEQSLNTTKEIMVERIGRMTDHADNFPDEQFFVFNVRTASIEERRNMLSVAIANYHPDLVILDGISDLLTDINDGPRTIELTEGLLLLANKHQCNITTVIHLNRTGDKSGLRGWLGSVLLQKSYEVFNCNQISQTATLSVEQTFSRKYRSFETLYYEVDNDGIPSKMSKPDLQPRDAKGRWIASEASYGQTKGGSADTLNNEYIIQHPDRTDKPWDWDLRRLFTDAMGNLPYMGSEQMMNAVMQLSHIRQKQYYYKVLDEAEQQGVIRKCRDRYQRVAIVLTPPG